MLAWMVYVIVVTLILGAAACAAERSAHTRKAPTRWLWGASIVASLLLPTVVSSVSIQLPSLSDAADQAAPQQPIALRQMTSSAMQPSAWLGAGPGRLAATPDVDTILTRTWIAASGVILLAILFNGMQVYRRKRSWERLILAGAPIYVSEDVGPAVVGLIRPRIVVPRWITRAAPETQTLVLAHEQSHLDARDAQLLAVAILLIVTMPWNLPLWWQLRRLRFAIEVDCDARVLGGGHDASLYGETLIMVGERQSTHFVVVAAMSESKSFLEQRIRKMLRRQQKFARLSATAMAGLGFALAASAAVVSPPNATPMSTRFLEGSGAPTIGETHQGDIQMTRYKNHEWNFALDIPANWNPFPAVPTNSPFEVIRFFSSENGTHGLIIFRSPYDPAVAPAQNVQKVQEGLAKQGFSNFATGATRIGSRPVLTLDFDKVRPDGKTWSVREYFIVDGTLSYVLGFGSTDRKAMFGLYDQMAKSFVFGAPPS